MNNKKKLIILSSIILGVLVAVLGVAYAAFTYDRTGNNSDLVLGDIYMHYRENNQLVLKDAMPFDIEKYTINPIMAEQTVEEVNELTACVIYYGGWEFDEGSTAETYCKGTGTSYGYTFQENLEEWMLDRIDLFEYLSSNNIIVQDGDSYVVNPIMVNQEIEDVNELMICIGYNNGKILDEGSTLESYCQGIGTSNGNTYQQNLDDLITDVGVDYFLNPNGYAGQYLLDNNVIVSSLSKIPYFEFTISGKNTYLDEDIWYEIVLNHGADHETRTTRIKDELLRFTLVEVIGEDTETMLLNNKKYDSLSNKRIWVETIKANTTSEINKKYRLYAWISEDTVIGNVNEDYTMEQWNDVFASIKVNVTGDFKEKELVYEDKYNVTDASCFETSERTIYMRNNNMTTEEMAACVSYFEGREFEPDEGSTIETFCQGTGTKYNNTFDNMLASAYFNSNNLSELEEINVLKSEKGVNILMHTYDSSRCGSNIIIPRTINGEKVVSISGKDTYNYFGSFSVIIPYGILEIGENAFHYKFISNIEIPSSVITIGKGAFKYNDLTNVVIPDSVINLDCEAFDEGVVITKNDDLDCCGIPE